MRRSLDHSATPETIVLGLDPQERGIWPDPTTYTVFLYASPSARSRTLPVFVLATDESPSRAELESTRQRINHDLKSRALETGHPAIALFGKSAAALDLIDRLLAYANDEKADLIAVTSHGRAGLARLALGSFAETLLRHSSMPVLFLPPEGREKQYEDAAPDSPDRKPAVALFATDLSAESDRAFELFYETARRRRLEVVVFHHLGIDPSRISTLASRDPGIAARWMERARTQGRAARYVSQDRDAETSDLILETAAREGAGLIGLCSMDSLFSEWVIGSVAPSVFRRATIPVWVAGSRAIYGAPKGSK